MKKMCNLVALMLIVMMLATGCGGNNNTSGNDTNTQQTGGSDAAARTDIKLCIASEVTSLDPYNTTASADYQVFLQMYEGMLFLNGDMELEPRVAEPYSVSDDGMTYTFNLRKGVKFHNGDELKASDVVFSITRAMQSTAMANRTASIESVKAVDDYTVEVKTIDVMAAALNQIVGIDIMSEKIVTEQGDNFGQTAVDAGTGPYMLDTYDRSTKITMKAFDDYYRGAPSIKDVTYSVMTDSSSSLIAFESGDLDLVTVPLSSWNMVSENSDYQTALVDTTHISYIALNPNQAPFDNENLRKAVAYAINKDACIVAAYEGLATKANGLLNPNVIALAPDGGVSYDYDPDLAKQYLADAGYPDGVDVGDMLVYGSGYWPKFAEIIQQNLADVGITVELVTMDTSAVIQDMKNGNYTMGTGGMACDREAGFLARFCHSRNIQSSAVKFGDPWIDEKLDESDRELDTTKRAALIQEVHDYVMETATLLPVFHKTTPYAYASGLTGSFDLNYYYIYNFSWN